MNPSRTIDVSTELTLTGETSTAKCGGVAEMLQTLLAYGAAPAWTLDG